MRWACSRSKPRRPPERRIESADGGAYRFTGVGDVRALDLDVEIIRERRLDGVAQRQLPLSDAYADSGRRIKLRHRRLLRRGLGSAGEQRRSPDDK